MDGQKDLGVGGGGGGGGRQKDWVEFVYRQKDWGGGGGAGEDVISRQKDGTFRQTGSGVCWIDSKYII